MPVPLNYFPEPSGEEQLVRSQAKLLADTLLRPFARQDDEQCFFRRDAFNKFAAQGLTALAISKTYGGAGLSSLSYYAALEEVARTSASMCVTIGVTNLVQGAITTFGTEKQKQEFLPRLCKGEWLGAFSLSEPQSGSDAAGLRTQVERSDRGYVITGTKVWCSSAGYADVYLVMARTSPDRYHGITAFLVSKDTPGFRVGKQEKKLGLRASPLAELIFEECEIPESHRIGEEGEGFKVALSQLDSGRIAIGVIGIALTTEAIERVFQFFLGEAKERPEEFEAARLSVSDYFARAQAIRSLTATASLLRDQGKRITTPAAQIKLLASDLAMQATSESVTLIGPAGSLREYEIERLMRDSKALQIVEGTNQIQRAVLAREMEEMMQQP
jgi:butyryl-CoA dehydrogenase